MSAHHTLFLYGSPQPLNLSAAQVELQCEIPHILIEGGSVVFSGSATVEMSFFLSCGSVWALLPSAPLPLCVAPVCVCVCACLTVWGLKTREVICWGWDEDTSLLCDCLLSPPSLSSPFPLYAFCVRVHMPASLPHDPDVVSCPESLNSASL